MIICIAYILNVPDADAGVGGGRGEDVVEGGVPLEAEDFLGIAAV